MAWAPTRIEVSSGGLTTSTTAYVTGDQVGTEFTIASAATGNAGYGAIVGIELVDYSKVLGAFELWIFSSSTTPASDNAAVSWSDADTDKLIAGMPFQMPAPVAHANTGASGWTGLWIPFKTGASTSSLYADIVTRSGHTFFGATTDLHLKLDILQYS